MTEAFLWGAFASGSLLLGAVIAMVRTPSRDTVGLVMAFGAGVLISAVAFELVLSALQVGGETADVVAGLFIGAAAFTLGDVLIGRFQRRHVHTPGESMVADQSGLAIVLGALLDGIPETAVLGLTLLQTGEIGVAMLVAVFISNLPEAVGATTDLLREGWKRSSVLAMWAVIVVLSASAAALGYALLDGASATVLAFLYTFAAGAILTMLATSMMPESFERAGRRVGFLTVLGFAVAFALSVAEAT